MKRKALSLLLAVSLLGGTLAACSQGGETGKTESSQNPGQTESQAAEENTTGEKVKISLLNTKSEIQTQLEEMAKKYGEAHNVDMEVLVTVGDSPSQDITKRYASGEAPTLFMGDVQDIYMLEEYALDMSDAKWASEQGGKEFGVVTDKGVIAFPFCLEARGLMYNKTAIEKATGESFVPEKVKTTDDLKALLDKLVAGGMETPVALNMEDWSLGGHYLTLYYDQHGADMNAVDSFIQDLKGGKVDVNADPLFTSLMDTFDVLADYNMNKQDPLAANYDRNAVALAEGDIAFWFNGNWAWAEMRDFASDDMEYGIMPVPQVFNENGQTDKLAGSASKRIMIDTKYNSEAQQKAAMDWLNWLVFDEEGQDFIVNECDLVPAFANNTLEVSNPLSGSVQEYANKDALIDGYPYFPGDHWKVMGAETQKYLAGQTDRDAYAKSIEAYWQKQQ